MPALRLRVLPALLLMAVGAALWALLSGGMWNGHVHAQSYAQIGTNSPLPVFVTNPLGLIALPEGFTPGSHWRFTTWSMPSTISWTATVNKTSGGWANLTITDERSTTTRWYFLPEMPGSWEPQ